MAKKIHRILSYFAVFDPAEEGGYNVSFPIFQAVLLLEELLRKLKQNQKKF